MAVTNDWPPADIPNQILTAGGTPRRFECFAAGYEPLYISAGTVALAKAAYARVLNIDAADVTAVPAS